MARLILHGGPIYTADPWRPWVRALAIDDDGSILEAGTRTAIMEHKGSDTRLFDLDGRLATPGFNDAHIHLQWGGVANRRLNLMEIESLSGMLSAIADRAEETGGWVRGRGWDERRFSEGRPPTLEELEKAAPGRPVFLKRVDGHSALASREALKRGGIDASTSDPEGGRIDRDEAGQPTGLLRERAMGLVQRVVPDPSEKERLEGLRHALGEAARCGVTSVQDHLGERSIYETLHARKELTVRASLWHDLEAPLSETLEARAAFDPASRWIRFGLLKGFLDGSLGSRTAALYEPYADDPDTTGLFNVEPEALIERVIAADGAGCQVGLHAIGDAACGLALDAFEAAANRHGSTGRRHRVEHAQILTEKDTGRFGELGVVASMQPVHLASDRSMVEPRLGERSRGAYPWRSLLQAGAPLAFGSDYPVEPIDVIAGLEAAVTRQDREKEESPLHPEEALSLREALDAYTLWAAWAEHCETWKGRLAPGFVGDVAVLSEDLFRLPPTHLTKAAVTTTILNGTIVYDSG